MNCGRRIESGSPPDLLVASTKPGELLSPTYPYPMPCLPRYYFAHRHFEKAGELDPNFKLGLLGLINLECRVKKTVENAWIDELAKRLRETPFAAIDRNILYHIKEMSIAGSLCLSRSSVEQLFTAAMANTTIPPSSRAFLPSWQADYLIHTARDLPIAQSELKKSLAISPNNPSNLLKLSQLAFSSGGKSREYTQNTGSSKGDVSTTVRERYRGYY